MMSLNCEESMEYKFDSNAPGSLRDMLIVLAWLVLAAIVVTSIIITHPFRVIFKFVIDMTDKIVKKIEDGWR